MSDISNLPLNNVLEHQQKSLISRWEPGMYYSYSSVGYTLLGYILEKITGVSYEEYVKNEILIPFGMVNSGLELENFPNEQTVGYDNKYNQLPLFYMYARPAGSMFSTLNDMSAFIQIMLQNGSWNNEQIIDSVLIAQIEKSQTGLNAEYRIGVGYGSGIFSTQKNGYKWFYHNGGGPGCLASYFYSHELGKGFCIMTNVFNVETINKVKNLLFESLNPKKTVSNNEQNNLNPAEYKYLGYYELKNHRNELFSFLDNIFSGIKVYEQNSNIIIKELFAQDKRYILYKDDLYRKSGDREPSVCIFKTESKKSAVIIGNNYYEKSSRFKFITIWLYISLVLSVSFFLILDFVITIIKILIYWTQNKKVFTKIFELKVIQVVTLAFLILPLILVSKQSLIDYSQKTFENILLFVGTWVFLFMSFISVLYSVRFKILKLKSKWSSLYITTSIIIFSLAIILFNLGVIGFKLWSY